MREAWPRGPCEVGLPSPGSTCIRTGRLLALPSAQGTMPGDACCRGQEGSVGRLGCLLSTEQHLEADSCGQGRGLLRAWEERG